jgi:hypothetical protein
MAAAEEFTTKPARRRGWRIFFTTFKWCRISVLLLLLIVVVLGLFLNRVGLPDWLETRVIEQFRDLGWDVSFSRLRLRWYHGIVAEDLQLQRTNTVHGPHLFIRVAEFRLNSRALQHLDLEADSVMLRGATLRWPLPGTNQPQRTFALDDAGGELLFHPGDRWELKYLEGALLGIHVAFRGDITNASTIREWQMPSQPPKPGAGPGAFWHQLLTEVEKVRFDSRPELNVIFGGDARDGRSFHALMKFTALGAHSPWGSGTNIWLALNITPPPREKDPVRGDIRFTAEQVQTPWLSSTNVDLTVVAEPSLTHLVPTNLLALIELQGARTAWSAADRLFVEARINPDPTNTAQRTTRLDISANRFGTKTTQAGYAHITTAAVHPATNFLPAGLETIATAHDLRTPWATSYWAQAATKIELTNIASLRLSDTNIAWPDRLREIPIDLGASFSNAVVPRLSPDLVSVTAKWRYPLLKSEMAVELPNSSSSLAATIDTASRASGFKVSSRLGTGTVVPFLGTNARSWLAYATLQSPARLQVDGRLRLPPWSDSWAAHRDALFSSLEASGKLETDAGTFYGVNFSSIIAPFALTNLTWRLPALAIARPEGALKIDAWLNQRTEEFAGVVHSGVDLLALKGAFAEPRPQVFAWCQLEVPARIDARLGGNLRDLATFHAVADVALTNVVFRGVPVKAAVTQVTYTNRFLSILRPQVWREGEHAIADGIGIDLTQPRLFLTNAVGRLAPRAVTKTIGPLTDRAVAPFVFDVPPFARAEGSVPLGETDGTENMHFEIEGGPFHWKVFNLEQIKGSLFWHGNSLLVTNVQGRWHGAEVQGWTHFDFSAPNTDHFSFYTRVTNASLRAVLKELQPAKSSKVEGTVAGELYVTSANTRDWKSWQGYGQAHLTNGLLWEIPLFGVFSPVLNAFFPGLGNSRARHATATYQITNSVILTTNLEIRATAMRMKYNGTVDFEQRVAGTMEAELFRDLPAFGYLFSKLLWPVTKLFEYEVGGTLENPKTKQRYLLSNLFTLPFAPIKSLKDLFDQGLNQQEKSPNTRPPGPVPPARQPE